MRWNSIALCSSSEYCIIPGRIAKANFPIERQTNLCKCKRLQTADLVSACEYLVPFLPLYTAKATMKMIIIITAITMATTASPIAGPLLHFFLNITKVVLLYHLTYLLGNISPWESLPSNTKYKLK